MGLPAELFGGRGPTRWRKVSDTVAGFLRADGKLAPIYADFLCFFCVFTISHRIIPLDTRLLLFSRRSMNTRVTLYPQPPKPLTEPPRGTTEECVYHPVHHNQNSFFSSSISSYGKHSAEPSLSSRYFTIFPANSIPCRLCRTPPSSFCTVSPMFLADHT